MRIPPRTRLLWTLLGLASVASAGLAWRLSSQAFPVVDLKITMERKEALAAASAMAARHGWTPAGASQAASFQGDSRAQAYVELTAGGNAAFRRVLQEKIYSPYTWRVRLFKEGEQEEAHVYFTPEGKPLGFRQVLSETRAGAALEPERARSIAERSAREDFRVDLDRYRLVSSSRQTRKSGRVDHVFVYEREGAKLGEATYRLQLGVQGDRPGELIQYLNIPESFGPRYEELRSGNRTLSSLAGFFALGVFALVGGMGGLAYLARQHALAWRPALTVGAGLAALATLASLNSLPSDWMAYDTAIPVSSYLAQRILSAGFAMIGFTLLFSALLAVAEGLTRRAFRGQPYLWASWSRPNAASPQILGRTLAGYVIVGFDLLFVSAFYAFTTSRLGWWVPSESHYDPDLLATYQPWIQSVSGAAMAGITEESLFRAIPIAGAALLGERWGRRKLMIGIAVALQTVVFAAAHADYPGLPAYSRLVELVVPSLLFAWLYLRLGLLPGMVLHFIYDLALMSIPLFVASGLVAQKALVVACGLLPLAAVVAARLREKRWSALPVSALNSAWKAPARKRESRAHGAAETRSRSRLLPWVGAAGLVALAATWIVAPPRNPYPPVTVGRADAIAIGRRALEKRYGASLPESDWSASAAVVTQYDEEHEMILDTESPETYRRLLAEGFLQEPAWRVRLVRWGGSAEDREEEYQAFVRDGGGPESGAERVRHEIPEHHARRSLSEAEARALAAAVIRERHGIDVSGLKEVVSESSQKKAWREWTFTYVVPPADPSIPKLKSGETRVGVIIAGNEVVGSRKLVHVPEEWRRADRARGAAFGLASTPFLLLLGIGAVASVGAAIVSLGRSRGGARARRALLACAGAALTAGVLHRLNGIPEDVFRFSTGTPFGHQVFRLALTSMLTSAALAGVSGALGTYLAGHPRLAGGAPSRDSLFAAAGLGLLAFAAREALSRRVEPDLWAASLAVPALSTPYRAVLSLLLAAVLLSLLLAAERAARRFSRPWVFGGLACLFFGGAWATMAKVDSLGPWLGLALAASALAAAGYRLVFRGNPANLAFTILVVALAGELRGALLGEYPGARAAAVAFAAIVALGVFAASRGERRAA